MAAAASGQSWAVLAASEMGKGVWLKARLMADRPTQLIIWDRNDEYQQQAHQVASLQHLARQVLAGGAYRLRYVPRSRKAKALRDEFEAFCLIAFEAAGSTIVVEELADVSSPSFAPPAWRQLNTRGRHHQGLTLYWLSQSPAFVDKASLGNATHMHVGYLGEPRHRMAAAAHMGCSAADIDALQQFEFIEYVKATKERTHGRVSRPAARKQRAA